MEELSPIQLEDLYKQAAVSLGYPNLKEEQKRVVTSFFLGERHFHSQCRRHPSPFKCCSFVIHHHAGFNISHAMDTTRV